MAEEYTRDSDTVLMPLKYRREGTHSYLFCKFFPHVRITSGHF
jgi:hypothetical protein